MGLPKRVNKCGPKKTVPRGSQSGLQKGRIQPNWLETGQLRGPNTTLVKWANHGRPNLEGILIPQKGGNRILVDPHTTLEDEVNEGFLQSTTI